MQISGSPGLPLLGGLQTVALYFTPDFPSCTGLFFQHTFTLPEHYPSTFYLPSPTHLCHTSPLPCNVTHLCHTSPLPCNVHLPSPHTCTVTSFPPICASITGSPTLQSVPSTTVSPPSISTLSPSSAHVVVTGYLSLPNVTTNSHSTGIWSSSSNCL